MRIIGLHTFARLALGRLAPCSAPVFALIGWSARCYLSIAPGGIAAVASVAHPLPSAPTLNAVITGREAFFTTITVRKLRSSA